MEEDRDIDKKTKLIPKEGSRKSKQIVPTLDVVKSAFITEGLSELELCERFGLSEQQVADIVAEHKLTSLRNQHIKAGLEEVQSGQVNQAARLLEIEQGFRQLRIMQLEDKLKNVLAYYARHETFNKFHPVTGELLEDSDGLPIQISIPNILKEIENIKSSMVLSEGLKSLIVSIEDIIGAPRKSELGTGEEDTMDVDFVDLNQDINSLFEQRDES